MFLSSLSILQSAQLYFIATWNALEATEKELQALRSASVGGARGTNLLDSWVSGAWLELPAKTAAVSRRIEKINFTLEEMMRVFSRDRTGPRA